MKKCKKCLKNKQFTKFPISRGRMELQCKSCKYAATTIWRKNNPDIVAAQRKQWAKDNPEKIKQGKTLYRQRHPDRVKKQIENSAAKKPEQYAENKYRYWLKKKYGLTKEQYEYLLNKQNGLCAICRGILKNSIKHKKLSVDHCHTRKKVRGLLCFRCNVMLGAAGDLIYILQSAIEYLKETNI